MTTTVTITTHGLAAEVRTFPLIDGVPVDDAAWSEPQRVEPNSTQSFVVHSGQDIMVREPTPEAT